MIVAKSRPFTAAAIKSKTTLPLREEPEPAVTGICSERMSTGGGEWLCGFLVENWRRGRSRSRFFEGKNSYKLVLENLPVAGSEIILKTIEALFFPAECEPCI